MSCLTKVKAICAGPVSAPQSYRGRGRMRHARDSLRGRRKGRAMRAPNPRGPSRRRDRPWPRGSQSPSVVGTAGAEQPSPCCCRATACACAGRTDLRRSDLPHSTMPTYRGVRWTSVRLQQGCRRATCPRKRTARGRVAQVQCSAGSRFRHRRRRHDFRCGRPPQPLRRLETSKLARAAVGESESI